MYMQVWSSFLGECLFDKKEPSNGVDKNVVAEICLTRFGKEELVHHVPQNNSKVVSLYLSLSHCYLELEVTGKCVNHGGRYGLEFRQVFGFFWT